MAQNPGQWARKLQQSIGQRGGGFGGGGGRRPPPFGAAAAVFVLVGGGFVVVNNALFNGQDMRPVWPKPH